MKNKESWKPVRGCGDWYEVSSAGKVRRKMPGRKSVVGRLLKTQTNHRGYPQVRLSIDCKKKTMTVHRAVAFAFLGTPTKKNMEVNHKNGVKTDNRAENLEWVSRSENMKHLHRTLKWKPQIPRGSETKMAKLDEQTVLQLRRKKASGEMRRGQLTAIAVKFGMSAGALHNAINGVSWKHVAAS